MEAARVIHEKFLEPSSFSKVSALLEDAVEQGVFPGVVLLAARYGEILYKQGFGTKSARIPDSSPMTVDTVFDIASLTNVLATTTLIIKLVESGKLKLEDKVARYIQSFGVHGKSSITLGHLLSHTSGLPSWAPFFEELIRANGGSRLGILTSRGAKEYVISSINRSQPRYPCGVRQIYSDIGFIILGVLVEVLTGLSLDKAFYKHVSQPLGLKSTSFVDLSLIKRRGIHPVTDVIAPTEDCPWRKRILWGEVHDDNAWAMGGIAGHSGIFSSISDLHLFCREMILAYREQSNFLKKSSVQKLWHGLENGGQHKWLYGWDVPSKENGLLDSNLSENAVGICGFTGCSMWLEPEKGIHIIMLSNRVHPSRANKKIVAFRPVIHDAVLEVLA